ncbi:MAG: nitroreductase/quinone reductase family protein [bacterium]|nr:nitroreductase/quinone reductase family protein [bacterium]
MREGPLINSFVQGVASSRLGAWFLSRTLHHLDRLVLRVTGGRTTMTGLLTGLPVVVLTATGARSGLPRTLPLLCVRDELTPNAFALVASNWGGRHNPAWYSNLKANPRAVVSVGGQVGEYVAREASGGEYERLWRLAEDTYAGFRLYKARACGRRIPIVIMTVSTA